MPGLQLRPGWPPPQDQRLSLGDGLKSAEFQLRQTRSSRPPQDLGRPTVISEWRSMTHLDVARLVAGGLLTLVHAPPGQDRVPAHRLRLSGRRPAGARRFRSRSAGSIWTASASAYISGGGVQAVVSAADIENTMSLRRKPRSCKRSCSELLRGRAKDARDACKADCDEMPEEARPGRSAEALQKDRPSPGLGRNRHARGHAGPGRRAWPARTAVGNAGGLSNPLAFCVGQLPEFCENEAGTHRRPARPPPGA